MYIFFRKKKTTFISSFFSIPLCFLFSSCLTPTFLLFFFILFYFIKHIDIYFQKFQIITEQENRERERKRKICMLICYRCWNISHIFSALLFVVVFFWSSKQEMEENKIERQTELGFMQEIENIYEYVIANWLYDRFSRFGFSIYLSLSIYLSFYLSIIISILFAFSFN